MGRQDIAEGVKSIAAYPLTEPAPRNLAVYFLQALTAKKDTDNSSNSTDQPKSKGSTKDAEEPQTSTEAINGDHTHKEDSADASK